VLDPTLVHEVAPLNVKDPSAHHIGPPQHDPSQWRAPARLRTRGSAGDR
jgi:hypothetical protein